MLDQTISKRYNNEEELLDFIKSNEFIKQIDTDEDSLDDFFAQEIEDEEGKTSWSDGGEVVAACIIAAATLIENRLATGVEKTKQKLELKSQKVISRSPVKSRQSQVVRVDSQIEAILTDDAVELYSDSDSIKNKGVQFVNYTDKARKASEKLKENTKNLTTGIRGTTTEAIIMISERADEVDVAGKLCPSAEGKEIFDATGKVAISGLGAASRLLDALYLSTKEVAKKSCEVTADVARHRYGEDAGKLVENTAHAVGNTLRTVHLLSQVHGSNFAKTIGRDTGKAKLNKKESSGSNSSGSVRADSLLSISPRKPKLNRKESIGSNNTKAMNSPPHTSRTRTDGSKSERNLHRKENSNRKSKHRDKPRHERSMDSPSEKSFNSRPSSERSSSSKENRHKGKRKKQSYDF